MNALVITTIVMLLVAAIFIHSVFFGAPFMPAQPRYVDQSFAMLDLQPGQHLLELGSGDGRVLIAAARRGIYTTGYEINPLLFAYSWLRTRRHHHYVTLVFGSYWPVRLPDADAVYVFLLAPYMERLDAKLTAEFTRPTKVFSFIFHIPGRVPTAEAEGVYVYQYGDHRV